MYSLLLLYVYPPTPEGLRWSDCPVACFAALRSLHCASSSATATGFVHKSRCDSTVCRVQVFYGDSSMMVDKHQGNTNSNNREKSVINSILVEESWGKGRGRYYVEL